MKFTTTVLDLKTLPKTSHVWNQLKQLTVSGWKAKDTFSEVRNGHYRKGTFRVMIVYHNSSPIAWGMRASFNEAKDHPCLWLYTHPDYRKQGIQKKIILKYWNKKEDKFVVQACFKYQVETFKHLNQRLEWKD
jgi:GNAT superfamily N-acetyltransferase